ncbi:MFS transporter [Aggregatilinea lenta]|uniref:MFS transporter n=1 Tax=Aggregatilinea lenta TaxID=913108 RepID=UPI000E5A3B10|nr:MFS transporter [Aggregatilinea lenta]
MNDKGNKNRWLGLLFICFSLLIISLDNTILNVALPAISTDLGASQAELQWIVDAYILVFASLLLTMGAIGDRIGRKRILQFGIAWFGVFSLMAALSNSVEMLVAARALLGLGGAIIMPATLSLVTASFRDPKERAQAIALWAAVFGLGAGIGPLVGGYLLEQADWSAVFMINLPVVAVALIGGFFFLEESKDEAAPSPDVPGVLLSIAGLFLLVYGIIEAGVDGWGASNVVTSLGVAAIILVVFFAWESRTKNPMLPLYLFRNPSFTGANVAVTLMFFGMLGVFFAISQLFQSVQGYTALETGYRLFLPTSLVLMFTAGMSAQVAQRIGTKRTVGLGFLLAASGMAVLSQITAADVSYLGLLGGLLMMTGGIGIAMSPATNSIMGSVPAHKAGVGSAMNDTTREIGGALGVAVLGTVINNAYLDQVATLKTQLPPEAYGIVSSSIQGAHAVASQIGGPVAGVIVDVANKAFAAGMADAMFIATFVMVSAALFTLIVLPSEISCIEDDCEDEVDFGTLPEPVAVAGD